MWTVEAEKEVDDWLSTLNARHLARVKAHIDRLAADVPVAARCEEWAGWAALGDVVQPVPEVGMPVAVQHASCPWPHVYPRTRKHDSSDIKLS